MECRKKVDKWFLTPGLMLPRSAHFVGLPSLISPYRISQDFSDFCGLKLKFCSSFSQICGDICAISNCFSVKIYHGQHSSNFVITFLTLRTIAGLQNKHLRTPGPLSSTEPAPDSKALTLIAHEHLRDVLFDVCIYICKKCSSEICLQGLFLSDVK